MNDHLNLANIDYSCFLESIAEPKILMIFLLIMAPVAASIVHASASVAFGSETACCPNNLFRTCIEFLFWV